LSRAVSVSTDLVVRNRDGLVDNVANGLDLGLQELLLLGGRGQQLLLLLLEIGWDTSARRASQIGPGSAHLFASRAR